MANLTSATLWSVFLRSLSRLEVSFHFLSRIRESTFGFLASSFSRDISSSHVVHHHGKASSLRESSLFPLSFIFHRIIHRAKPSVGVSSPFHHFPSIPPIKTLFSPLETFSTDSTLIYTDQSVQNRFPSSSRVSIKFNPLFLVLLRVFVIFSLRLLFGRSFEDSRRAYSHLLRAALPTVVIVHILLYPYLNTDAGTMSPFEHAEVFVLDDSGEFVIEKERRGDYGRGEVKLGQPWGSLLRLLKI
ncbi:uncharacterized protein LOC128196264 [Vigna angularis]|uniref:uncharacterized protein LOC128196264 n=1 Tax=Phaseolus angularis TaxID=3914 RepID=UPI0022B4DB59|nr:uncharacterized protein LOC128196264 [Vigna angularis]